MMGRNRRNAATVALACVQNGLWRDLLGGLGAVVLASAPAIAEPLPRIARGGATAQIIVDEKPWITLAGEVHNSSASSSAYMRPIWDRLAQLNVNTVITPAYWDLVEPVEGQFDFGLIDEQLRQAREREIRLVLLWFGSIKNAKSTYAPEWVLSDRRRFPRAVTRPSALPFAKGPPPLSIFNQALADADAKAFARLMAHLAQVDPQHTVIAVQVENETGLLGDARDRSALAEEAWSRPVPPALTAYLTRHEDRLAASARDVWARNGKRRAGSWQQVFGNDWQAEEIFMAWHMGQFVEKVASAGKASLALPMYANAWVGPQKSDEIAGSYPSGGPVPRVFDIWRAGAPSLDWLSPDIYVDDFGAWAGAYAFPGNPLFVPEARFIAGNLFLALGHYRAAGFSPFGIEAGVPGNQMSEAYALLRGALPVIATAQAKGDIAGFALSPGETRQIVAGDYRITVQGQRDSVSKMLLDMGISIPPLTAEKKPQNIGDHVSEMTDARPMGLVLPLDRDEFLVVGKDLALSFERTRAPGEHVEILRVEEGRYVDGQWVRGRVLNGDERLRILPGESFGMARIKLLRAE